MTSTSTFFYTDSINKSQSEKNKFTPPFPLHKKASYDILDTSPIKANYAKFNKDSRDEKENSQCRCEENSEIDDNNDKTATKNYQFTNNYSTNLDTNPLRDKRIYFSSNFSAERKENISPGKLVLFSESSKPSLNITESRNKIFKYSKSKTSSYCNENQISASIFCLSKFSSNSRNENREYFEEEENIDYRSKLLLEQEKTLPVPVEKKDDEKFKILKMKELKRASAPPNKSVKSSEDLSPGHRKDFELALNYSLNKKKKISHSVKKNFSTLLTLLSSSNDKHYFPLYKDNEIGVYEYWQAHIIESKTDEDNDSDEEQLTLARDYVLIEMQEAFDLLEEKGANEIRNRKLIINGEGVESALVE